VLDTVGDELTVGAVMAAAVFDVVPDAVAVAVGFDECLDVSAAVVAVVGSAPVCGSAVGVAVAVSEGVALAVRVVGVGDPLADGVEVEVLVCALTTTPGPTSVAVEVPVCVPDVDAVDVGCVVDCVDVVCVDVGSGLAVPVDPVEVDPVDVEPDVDELDEPEVPSVVSADATPYPVATAVPTPSATAKPPTRPTNADAGIALPRRFPRRQYLTIKADPTATHSKRGEGPTN
jgi:hypothetical protein